jgi:hypothetical protein
MQTLNIKRSTSGSFAAGVLLAGAAGLLSLGCQPAAPARPDTVGGSAAALPTDHKPTADEVVASDVSASRLHDIVGAILTYYISNGYRLPNFLEDVKPFADVGTELNFTSPSSGLPYVYSPDGLFTAGSDKRIIVWEPKPSKQGIRWCILMPHIEPGKAIIPEVVPITEKAFAAFVPAVQ